MERGNLYAREKTPDIRIQERADGGAQARVVVHGFAAGDY
jgi:hypothetical protein